MSWTRNGRGRSRQAPHVQACSAARRALAETLPEQFAAAVWKFVNGALLDRPYRVRKRLRFALEGFFSARRGQYRVIYRVHDQEVAVEVVKISHRADADTGGDSA